MAKAPASPDVLEPAVRRRTGGRSARVKQAVLDAALTVLTEKGFAGFTIAEVAALAGVHETSIYRRWGRPADLITEASLLFADRQIPLPDTGSLAGDLIAMHREGLAFYATPLGHALMAWSASAPSSVEYNAISADYWTRRGAFLGQMFERARARGEWVSDEPIVSILPRLIGPVYFRHFFLRAETSEADLREIVADFLKTDRG